MVVSASLPSSSSARSSCLSFLIDCYRSLPFATVRYRFYRSFLSVVSTDSAVCFRSASIQTQVCVRCRCQFTRPGPTASWLSASSSAISTRLNSTRQSKLSCILFLIVCYRSLPFATFAMVLSIVSTRSFRPIYRVLPFAVLFCVPTHRVASRTLAAVSCPAHSYPFRGFLRVLRFPRFVLVLVSSPCGSRTRLYRVRQGGLNNGTRSKDLV